MLLKSEQNSNNTVFGSAAMYF